MVSGTHLLQSKPTTASLNGDMHLHLSTKEIRKLMTHIYTHLLMNLILRISCQVILQVQRHKEYREDPAALSHTTACGNSTLLPNYSLQEFDENQTEDPLVPQSAAPKPNLHIRPPTPNTSWEETNTINSIAATWKIEKFGIQECKMEKATK
jgi:hypothetical protein